MAIWVNSDGNLIVDSNGKPISCSTCPCSGGSTTVDACGLCSGQVPDTFNVTISNIINASCTECTDLNGQYQVTYQGTTNCSGTTWHYWASTADVYNKSTSVCSGRLSNKHILINIRKNSTDCVFEMRSVGTTYTACSTAGTTDSFRFSGSMTVSTGDPCVDQPTTAATGLYDTAHCNQDSFGFVENWTLFTT